MSDAYLELKSTLSVDCDLSVELMGGTPDPILIDKEVTENGLYNAVDDNATGYSSVDVSVPEPVLIDKQISDNGTYHASDDEADGYANVTVEIPPVVPTLIDKSISDNGTYHAVDDSADGYANVTVNVEPDLMEKSVTENGVYIASQDQVDGYSKVTVEIPPVVPTLITKNVTDNGTYNASDEHADGYSQVVVNVPPNVAEKGVTANGTYLASSDNVDGYSKVTVNVQPTLVEKSITDNGTYFASGDSADGYSKVIVDVVNKITFTPKLIFEPSGIGGTVWTATDGTTTMTINQGSYVNGAVVGEYVNTDETLTNNLCMSFPVDGSAFAFGIKVQVDPNFTPMDTNAWYEASCILGQELGGEQRDFAIVIDKNGYFAMGWETATIVSSTVSALDGQIHTLFIICEIESSVYKLHLFIDGVEVANGTKANQTYWSNMNNIGVMWNKASSYSHRRVNGKVYSVGYWTEIPCEVQYALPTL